jgi:UbiD family decarboxylase
VNCRRRGPTFLFDDIRGFSKGRRILTGSILDAQRLALTLGLRDIYSDQDLVSRLEGKMTEYELRSAKFPVDEVSDGPILQNQMRGEAINLLSFPAPKWHEFDGGNYI